MPTDEKPKFLWDIASKIYKTTNLKYTTYTSYAHEVHKW